MIRAHLLGVQKVIKRIYFSHCQKCTQGDFCEVIGSQHSIGFSIGIRNHVQR